MEIQSIKAGALQMTIFISVVIALLLTAFILFVHLQKKLNIQHDFIVEMVQDADIGIRQYLTHPMTVGDISLLMQDSFDYKSVELHSEYWGLFEKVISTAKIKNGQFQKVALIGGAQPRDQRTALYLEDNNNSLILIGNTKIEGLAYLPQKGVKRGSVLGKSYYGEELIYGPRKKSFRLPKLNSKVLSHVSTLFGIEETIDNERLLDISSHQTYSNSFLKPTQLVFSPSEIQLSQIKIKGNIIVKSNSKITIDSTAKLADVILIAPEIEILKNVSGNFQAIASQSITIRQDAILEYPSAILMIEDQQKRNNNTPYSTPEIHIEKGVDIKGVVILNGKENENKSKVNIDIKEGATIIGELYCNQNLNLSGQVIGSVFTHNFIMKQSDYVFQNHIYNGQINIDKLPLQYVGLPFIESKKGVLQWLY